MPSFYYGSTLPAFFGVSAMRPSQISSAKAPKTEDDQDKKPMTIFAMMLPNAPKHEKMLYTPLPLTARLGFPLAYSVDDKTSKEDPPGMFETRRIVYDFSDLMPMLTTDCDPTSSTFGKYDETLSKKGWVVFRIDRHDLDPKHLEVLRDFLSSMLPDVHAFGKLNTAGAEDTEEKIIAKKKAEAAVTRLTTDNLTIFLNVYQPLRARMEGGAWETFQPPSDEGPVFCQICGCYGALQKCGGCKISWCCGKECQKVAWEHGHKTVCKWAARVKELGLEGVMRNRAG